MATEYIDRPPRIQPELPIAEHQIPAPPEPKGGADQSIVSMILPLVTILGFVFVSGSGNALFILPMGLAMVLSIGYAILTSGKDRKEFEAKKKAYQDLLATLRQEMMRSHNTQRIFYRHNYPDIPTVLDIAARQEVSRFGSRLWERRTTDSDFGAVRLGTGSRPSTVVYRFEQRGGSDFDQSPLSKDAQKLDADSRIVADVPITIPLRPFAKDQGGGGNGPAEGEEKSAEPRAVIPRHGVGIFGKSSTSTADFGRAVLMHFTAFHSAIDTRLYVVGLPRAKTGWEWAEWLPHCNVRSVGFEGDSEVDKPKQLDQLCFDPQKDKVVAFWKRIQRELDSRQVRLRDSEDDDKKKGGDVTLPLLVVVVDLLGEMPADSPLKDVASESVVATITQNGPTLGAAIIFLANEPSKIPSDCKSMVEVAAVGEKVVFRYTEVGLNTPRYIGDADVVTATDARQKFAAKIRRLDLRRPFGADLPRYVDLLQMQSVIEARRIANIDKITFKENWERSMVPANSEWLSAPIGMSSLRDVRNLVFSAKEGGDGVHGMIAGTTGSGKSELLLTLIAELAVKYDPRIVNFVLVDFKGGAAFEPFKKLPHCVDILTNLQANAVERMFVAIQAVMDERSVLLARSGMKDLVDYRKKAPYLRDKSLPRTFPHLFIIVDEFAEMITANPDYKNKFESVTRLGRAFGVTLILATQRPAGVVTDQMRANMKFRICLRVETPDDSKELLSSPEAAFLPNLGGRGYIQVGNDVLESIQVARAGGDYSDDRTEVLRDVIWLDDEALPSQASADDQPLFTAGELAEALGMNPGEIPATMVDWVVGIAAVRAKRDGIPHQRKPWPDPLPEHLALTEPVDAEYLNTERTIDANQTIVVNEQVRAWQRNTEEKPLWPAFDWKAPLPLRVDIGIVDNPYRAEQRLLTIDLATDPVVLFGSAGRGKTFFVKTLLTALAASRSPNELHMYALDFGRGGLKAVTALPHLGASIDSSEVARVDQLLRMLRNIVNERQERLGKYASLADYNAKNPGNVFPEVVVVIDNFAEFKESFEHQIPDLMSLIRDGRAFGVYFVITASNTTDLTGKLYNLMTQRLTLSMPDRTVYSEVVGSGAPNFDNVPGRGLLALALKDKPVPLEFQVAVPGAAGDPADVDRPDPYQEIAQRMEKVWFAMGGTRPAAELPRSINFLEMYGLILNKKIERIGDLPIADKWKQSMMPDNQSWLRAPIGLISSKEVRQMYFQAQADGVHGMVAGTTGSGKSELLLTLIAAMGVDYDPRIVNFVLVDFKGGAAFEPFKKLPHCVDIATNLMGNAVERIFIAIKAEMDRRAALLAKSRVDDLVKYRKRVVPQNRPELPDTFPHLFVIVDEFAEMLSVNPEYRDQFESITRLGRAYGVTLILATQRPAGVVSDQMRANMKFRICLRVETPEDSKELLKRPDAARLPQLGGRGYIQAGSEMLTEVQVARSGGDYTDDEPDSVYPTEEILQALGVTEDSKPGLMIDWIVGALAAEAKRQGVPKQYKPWPDPLPEDLPLNRPLDATYLTELASAKEVILNRAVTAWIENTEERSLWQPWGWEAPLPMRTIIGLIDNPFRSEQRLLSFDLAGDPIIAFGGSGRGKSTFVKSLLLALAATHSPNELHMYALDFGRGGLKSLRALPHLGAIIDVSQPDRVEQLFRMLNSMMNERQDKLAKYATLEDYNAQHKDNPDIMFPVVVVAIDNFAEFKENYEYMVPELIAMVRDGRAFGIYYVITTGQTNDVPGKLYNVLGQRITFTLPDASAYMDIVGRGALSLANVPGRGLINIEGQPLEFHVGMPVIESEKDPYARIAERMEKVWFAQGGKRPAAEIPRSITLLEMYQRILGKPIDRIGELEIADNWRRSMLAENQEWLTASIGLVSSKEVRTMIFSAKAGGDGVHGMAAGTTGSGKSELIQTLISAMAIKYDPRIVNFVLVDYKGGPTVEPFRQLPHCVDIATNLQGNAVERIFIAINAEMNRRSDILAKAGVADLVEYRKKVIPTLKKGSPFPDTFPHLFIIVDEFAEMVTQNPEYKAKFESITRLGRSFGVSLILATQRPSGVVTDQMRANMKFRICLRVETADDSKEMLARPDAATLPAIGGRGYIQVGGGSLTEVQAAWSGAPYDETKPDPVYPVEEVLDALGNPADAPRSLLGWVVGALALEAKRQGIPKQFKPWPNPLLEQLPLNQPVNAEYIQNGRLGKEIVINPNIAAWMDNASAKPLWKAHDWKKPLSLEASIGVVDNTFLAEERILTVDPAGDPIVVFGASGRGKTTFVKSLVLSLAATHSPAELHMFALDFGRGGLKGLRSLPHMGGIIDTYEEERVERLMRMLRNLIDERQQRLQAYDSLADYNKKNPEAAFQSVLVVVDNVSEFKETFERFLPDLITLIRDGRSFGVYFVVTATLTNDVPLKLFNLLTQRVTFTLPDSGEYTTIVGRGWTSFNDVPGRGLVVELVDGTPMPLEFHTAIPVGEEETDYFREVSQRMETAWAALESKTPDLKAKRPKPVEPLAKFVDVESILPPIGEGPAIKAVPLGINDLDREPTMIEFQAKGPHLLVIGPPVTGKTTTLRSLVLSLAHSYPPEQVAMVLVDPSDPSRRFYNYGGADGNTLDSLPHVLATVGTPKEMDEVIKRLRAEYDEQVIQRLRGLPEVFAQQDNQARAIFVIIDHYDDAEIFNKSGLGLTGLSETGKGKNLHLVIGGSMGITRNSSDELRRRAESARYTLVLQDLEAVRYMGARGNFSVTKEMPPGRGFFIKAIQASMVQMAMPCLDSKDGLSPQEQLDQLVGAIRDRYPERARWSYHAQDLTVLEAAVNPEAEGEGEPQSAAAAPVDSESIGELSKLMAMQAELTQGYMAAQIADATPDSLASVEFEVPEDGDQPDGEEEEEAEAEAAGKSGKSRRSRKSRK